MGLLDGIFGGGGGGVDTGAYERAAAENRRLFERMYGEQKEMAQPWLQTGQSALGQLASGNFMQNWQADPSYQFRLDQGTKAIQGSLAARGLSRSGAALKALTEHGQNLASQEYGNIYNREYNRLSNLANIGQNTLGGLMGASQNFAGQMAQQNTDLANAQMAAQMANIQNRQTAGGGLGALIGGAAGLYFGGPAGAQIGAQMGAGAGQYLFSDKRVKTDLGKISKADIKEFKKSIKPYRFKYKDESLGEGEWVGVMAQDLEKSKLGRTVVEERDGVKVVNLKKLASLGLAMMADEAS